MILVKGYSLLYVLLAEGLLHGRCSLLRGSVQTQTGSIWISAGGKRAISPGCWVSWVSPGAQLEVGCMSPRILPSRRAAWAKMGAD